MSLTSAKKKNKFNEQKQKNSQEKNLPLYWSDLVSDTSKCNRLCSSVNIIIIIIMNTDA